MQKLELLSIFKNGADEDATGLFTTCSDGSKINLSLERKTDGYATNDFSSSPLVYSGQGFFADVDTTIDITHLPEYY